MSGNFFRSLWWELVRYRINPLSLLIVVVEYTFIPLFISFVVSASVEVLSVGLPRSPSLTHPFFSCRPRIDTTFCFISCGLPLPEWEAPRFTLVDFGPLGVVSDTYPNPTNIPLTFLY